MYQARSRTALNNGGIALELRSAAARITAIGEYYVLRSRSTWATYAGILFGLIGTAAIIAAFVWQKA